MIDIMKFLDDEVFPLLDRAEMLKALEPEDRGSYFSLLCPACKERRARIDRHGLYITCSPRLGCTYTRSLWDWARDQAKGSPRAALMQLATLAAAPQPIWDPDWERVLDAEWKLYNLREEAMAFFRWQLFQPENAVGLRFFMDLTQSPEEAVGTMDLGYYPPPKAMETFLKRRHYSRKDAVLARLLHDGAGTDCFGVLPIRDPQGRIMGFQITAMAQYLQEKPAQLAEFRSLHGPEAAHKALHVTEPKLFTLTDWPKVFNNWHYANGSDNILIAFAPLMALTAAQRGIPGVVFALGMKIWDEQLKDAKARGAVTVTLIPWGNESDSVTLPTQIRQVLSAGLKCRVIQDSGGFDPLALFRSLPREETLRAVADALPGAQWVIDRVLYHSCYKPDRERDWQCAMNECITILASAKDPSERAAGVEYLSTHVGISERALNLLVENMALHMQVVAQKNRYKKELEEATGTRPSNEEGPKPVRYLN